MARRLDYRERIHRALVAGMRRFGERVFSLSQETDRCYVPVDKGFLKHSGYVKDIPGGSTIGYVTPYAARVEWGGPAIPVTGTQIVKIPLHIRKAHARKGYFATRGTNSYWVEPTWIEKSVVGPHEVTYVNKKVIRFKPKISKFERGPEIVRIISEEPERKGQHYLGRALKDSLPHMTEDIEFELLKLDRISRG